MNKLTKNAIKCITVVVVLVGMKYAGNIEYNDDVISSISNELYQQILHNLGGSASDREICSEYQENKEEYDALDI